MKGTIKFFNNKKGWGFITGEDEMDYFVHCSQIRANGQKGLFEGDLVYFEVSKPDKNNRIQALKVEPILTLGMVTHELAKEGLHLMRIRDKRGVHGWYVADESENPVVNKEMDLMELAAYVGFSTNEE